VILAASLLKARRDPEERTRTGSLPERATRQRQQQ
jgi:hypothetical protein